MLDLQEYVTDKILEECSKEELMMIVLALIKHLSHTGILHNESLIDKRWFRSELEENRNSFEYKEKYLRDQIRDLRTKNQHQEIELAAYRKQYSAKKRTVN